MYTGLTGKVTIDGNKVAYISNWSVDMSRELIDVPVLGQSMTQKVAGQKTWSASADGAVYFGADGQGGQANLFRAMDNGQTVTCEFFLDDGTNGNGAGVRFSGKAMIESLSVDLSAEDKGNISISIVGVDELSFPGINPANTN